MINLLEDLDLDPTFINKFATYLDHIGWTHVDHPNSRILLFQGPLDDDQQPLQLVLPGSLSFQDARSRIVEALEVLTITEEESRSSLLKKIMAVDLNTAVESAEAIQREGINLNELINAVTDRIGPTLPENIEVVSNLEPRLKLINGDPNRIQLVIFNLVANARDAMQNGGKLIIETVNTEPEQRPGTPFGTTPNYVTLFVRDTGVGIDKANQERIFEPFFSTKQRGAGLGLTVSREIVKQLGGNITMQSEPLRGSVVKVQFPEASKRAGESGTVLVVQDEKLTRELMREILEAQGYTVLEASEAEEARNLSQTYSEKIHVLISDVDMPPLTGPELIEQLRSQRPDMKGLFLTSVPARTVEESSGPDVELNIREGFATSSLTGMLRELIATEED